ncbi:hypothetical protein PsorP6_004899 [Peronosclerospora sorghi]|uniref:Uncharacterized protein n=1 Tax=Peronosclerospora sorghi TaxID=230839 RepID=A0ACC0W6R7_9STRA|nr:hypothetical protein PsorP6_004899 [Peronosclerospora sorghi]
MEEEHESLADDTMYDDDALTTCSCPMTAFPATSKNWWGMQHGLEKVELNGINSVVVFASRGNGGQAQWGALDNDDAVGHATMSMSVINAHGGECEDIELDFAPYRAL